MVRFSSVPGDQRLLLIRCHFKTMPVYGAKVRTLIHTRVFLNNRKPSTCGFDFAISGMVGGSLSSPVNRHSFVRDGTTARLSAGPVGHFCPTGPYPSSIPALLRLDFYRGGLIRRDWGAGGIHGQTMLGAALNALAAYHAGIWVNRPRSTLAIDRERARRAATRAHAAADTHVHVIDDMPTQAFGRRQLLLRITNRNRLLDHRTQGRLGKCQ